MIMQLNMIKIQKLLNKDDLFNDQEIKYIFLHLYYFIFLVNNNNLHWSKKENNPKINIIYTEFIKFISTM